MSVSLKKDDMVQFFEGPIASQLEELRDEARTKRRITYDCFNARVKPDGITAYCSKGHPLSGRGARTLALLAVLRGRSAKVCQSCLDYDPGELPK